MNENALNDLPMDVVNRFVRECEDREEEPSIVLNRLLLDYIRRDDIESRITEMHAAIVGEDTPVLVEDGGGPDVEFLEEYDPDGEGRLTQDALKGLTEIDERIAVNPSHVTGDSLPQDTQIKRELIKALARHKHTVLKKYDVDQIAKDLLDIGSRYRQRQYVDPVWNDMTVLSEPSVTVTSISDVDATLAWMDEQLEKRGAEAETDIYWLASELHHSDKEVSDEALSERLNQISLSIDGLYSPE